MIGKHILKFFYFTHLNIVLSILLDSLKGKITIVSIPIYLIFVFTVHAESQYYIYTRHSNDKRPISLSIGKGHSVPKYFLGLNGNLLGADRPWNHSALKTGFEQSCAKTLRYPGGTIANYWDWERGCLNKFFPKPRILKNQKSKSYSLENLNTGYQQLDFMPIFVLNMVTDTLDHQIAMLHKAQQLGLPIKFLELGNEFYHQINNKKSLVHQKFSSIKAYVTEANRWALILKKKFPASKISIVGVTEFDSPRWTTLTNWNHVLSAHISHDIDAISLHPYLNLEDITYLSKSVLTFYDLVGEIKQLTNKIKIISSNFDNKEIWITEFNIIDQLGHFRNTWAHSLLISIFYIDFLENKNVILTCLHNITDSGLFAAIKYDRSNESSPSFQLSSSGIIMRIFGLFLNNKDMVYNAMFSTTPKIKGDRFVSNALIGLFSTEDNEIYSLLILNFGNENQEISLDHFISSNHHYNQWSANQNTLMIPLNDVSDILGISCKSITLPPYSITLINDVELDRYVEKPFRSTLDIISRN